MRLAILNQCDISAGECAACLDLSFHLCINLLSQHSVTEDILFSVLQLNFISLLLFPLKTLSEWEQLNSENPQLSTHLSIRSFITLLPVSYFLYREKSHTRSYRFSTRRFICYKNNTQMFFTCILLPVCCSQCCVVLYPPFHTSTLPDNTAICLVIHPSSNYFPT